MKKYFTQANSALGFYDLEQENLTGIETIYYLKFQSKQLVNDLLTELSTYLSQHEIQVEHAHSPFNTDLITTLIARDLSLAIISGTSDEEDRIDLSMVFDVPQLEKNNEQLHTLLEDIAECYQSQARHFKLAIAIHDQWEKIYIDAIHLEKADQYREFVLKKLLGDAPLLNKKSHVNRRFFGASTGDGLIDFVPELTKGLKRFLIKGRPGSGKSTLMKAIARKCWELGYDTDIYHCSLDPKSLDMVVIPELKRCIFDATAPHEYEPTKPSDEILDTYEAFILPGIDQHFATELADIESHYKTEIRSGLTALKKAEALQEEVEAIYQKAIIPKRQKQVLDQLKEQINAHMKEATQNFIE